MRMIDADRLLNALNSVISDYTSEGKYPDRFGIDDAINLVEDAPTLTPLNEPLTLEQLREMDGEPVYIPEIECWALVKREQTTLLFTFSDGKQCPASEWYEQVGPVYRSSLNEPQANEWISEEQLWEMNNVPIWVVDTSINHSEWCLWRDGLAYSCEAPPEYYDPDDYGHWLAYSRPPEGES